MSSKSTTQASPTPTLTHTLTTIVEMTNNNVQPFIAQLSLQLSVCPSCATVILGRAQTPYTDTLKPYLTRQQYDTEVAHVCASVCVCVCYVCVGMCLCVCVWV